MIRKSHSASQRRYINTTKYLTFSCGLNMDTVRQIYNSLAARRQLLCMLDIPSKCFATSKTRRTLAFNLFHFEEQPKRYIQARLHEKDIKSPTPGFLLQPRYLPRCPSFMSQWQLSRRISRSGRSLNKHDGKDSAQCHKHRTVSYRHFPKVNWVNLSPDVKRAARFFTSEWIVYFSLNFASLWYAM